MPPPIKAQTFRPRRIAILDGLATLSNKDLTDAELRLIGYVRGIGYGQITVSVDKGEPKVITESISRIDLSKPLDFG